MPTFGGIVVSTGGSGKSGRRTLLDIVDELARPVDGSDSTVRALAADAFRAAVRSMNRRGNWPWEVIDEDIALTANTRFSTVQSAVKKPLAMHFLTEAGGVRDQRIGWMTYDRFMEIYDQNISGEPHSYTIPNLFETSQILWYPTPTGAYNARFTFYRVTPAPRVEAEAVEIPETAIETYMALAWAEFLKRLPEQQRPFPIAVAIQEARTSFRELCAHVNAPSDRSREMTIYV